LLASDSCDEDEAVGRGGGRGGSRSKDVVVGLGVANTTGDISILSLQDERMEGSDAVQALVASLPSLCVDWLSLFVVNPL
jgi:hypothetical protein